MDVSGKYWQVLAQSSHGFGIAHTAGSANLELATTLKVIDDMKWLQGCRTGRSDPLGRIGRSGRAIETELAVATKARSGNR